jgi:hypothetical protein
MKNIELVLEWMNIKCVLLAYNVVTQGWIMSKSSVTLLYKHKYLKCTLIFLWNSTFIIHTNIYFGTNASISYMNCRSTNPLHALFTGECPVYILALQLMWFTFKNLQWRIYSLHNIDQFYFSATLKNNVLNLKIIKLMY